MISIPRHRQIKQEGVGSDILELYSLGYNYSQIEREMLERHSELKISRFQIQRYITANVDVDKDIDWNDGNEVRKQVNKSKRQMSDLENDLQEFITNICRDRNHYNKEELWKHFRLWREKIHRSKSRFSTMSSYYNKHTKKVKELLHRFQLPLCYECRKKISEAIDEMEGDYDL